MTSVSSKGLLWPNLIILPVQAKKMELRDKGKDAEGEKCLHVVD